MQSLSRSLGVVGFAFLLTGAAAGQQREPTNHLPGRAELDTPQMPSFAPTTITTAVGMSCLDGTLVGGGPDYAVRFEGDRVEFTPAMPTAQRLFPLSMTTVGYGRGEPDLVPGAGDLSRNGHTASYDRAGFIESYEARQNGLKQSFTFKRLPAGTGDLVVRVLVETDLLPQAARGANGELRFLNGNVGGVTIGKVIGIDANGARVTGSMHYEGGALEMRLPESFVNNAALPLVLDPLVGSAFAATNGINDDSDLDIAYDASNNVYLATWRRRFSISSYGVRAQRINDTGGLIGGFISIDTLSAFTAPRVANVSTEDVFLVVYAQNNNILGRAVLAGSGVVSTQAVIRDTADALGSPDVGGESAFDNDGIVVWVNGSTGEIKAKQVQVDGDVSPPTVVPFNAVVTVGGVTSIWTNWAPSISNSGGTTGHHLIVWNRQFTGSPQTTVQGALVSRNLTVLDPSIHITLTTYGDCDLPSVDGDGRNWIVAWENEAVPGSGDNNVQARAIGYDPNALSGQKAFFAGGIVDIESGVNDDERAARVTWMGDSVLVMYEDETPTAGDFDIFAQPVDLFTAFDCGVRSLVDFAGGDQGPIRAASKATGGGSDDDALIAWSERNLTTAHNNGFARRFRSEDGVNTNLGGGCGTGGVSSAGCAIAGNSNFQVRLRSAARFMPAWWVLSPSRIDLPCGTCTLVPDPFAGFVVSRTTDSRGDASVAAPIPSGTALIGATFYHQWLILGTTPAACAMFGSNLSDALQTRIQ